MDLTLNAATPVAAHGLRERVEACAEGALGRLARRVRHAELSLREHERPARRNLHACTLRLSVAGAADIVVESLRPDPDAAVAAAFRRARRELMRRRPRRTAAGWRPQPLPAAA